jgi:hypothetical protein
LVGHLGIPLSQGRCEDISTPVRDNCPKGFVEQLYGQNRAFTRRVLRGTVRSKAYPDFRLFYAIF